MGDQTNVILSPFNSSDCLSQVKYYHTVKTKFDEHFVVHRRFLERAKFSRRRQEGDRCTQSPNTVIWGGPMSLVWILKRLVSVFINASCRCRKMNENSLSLSEF